MYKMKVLNIIQNVLVVNYYENMEPVFMKGFAHRYVVYII